MPMRKIEGGGRTAAPVFREFIQNYIKEFPDTKRKFDTPKEVYHKIYEGNDAIYTDTSPLPKQQINAIDMQEGGLIF